MCFVHKVPALNKKKAFKSHFSGVQPSSRTNIRLLCQGISLINYCLIHSVLFYLSILYIYIKYL